MATLDVIAHDRATSTLDKVGGRWQSRSETAELVARLAAETKVTVSAVVAKNKQAAADLQTQIGRAHV